MVQLRKFNLKLAFTSPGSLCKDVQNQTGAVQDFAFENLFQIAGLRST